MGVHTSYKVWTSAGSVHYIFQDTRLRLRVSTLLIRSGHIVRDLGVQTWYKDIYIGSSWDIRLRVRVSLHLYVSGHMSQDMGVHACWEA